MLNLFFRTPTHVIHHINLSLARWCCSLALAMARFWRGCGEVGEVAAKCFGEVAARGEVAAKCFGLATGEVVARLQANFLGEVPMVE